MADTQYMPQYKHTFRIRKTTLATSCMFVYDTTSSTGTCSIQFVHATPPRDVLSKVLADGGINFEAGGGFI